MEKSMRFRKKPVEIEAVQWTGKNADEIRRFMDTDHLHFSDYERIEIDTLEGRVYAAVGDWIIKGVKGEFYPCKPDIFEMTYEEVK
jgi:hypothetical protein